MVRSKAKKREQQFRSGCSGQRGELARQPVHEKGKRAIEEGQGMGTGRRWPPWMETGIPKRALGEGVSLVAQVVHDLGPVAARQVDMLKQCDEDILVDLGTPSHRLPAHLLLPRPTIVGPLSCRWRGGGVRIRYVGYPVASTRIEGQQGSKRQVEEAAARASRARLQSTGRIAGQGWVVCACECAAGKRYVSMRKYRGNGEKMERERERERARVCVCGVCVGEGKFFSVNKPRKTRFRGPPPPKEPKDLLETSPTYRIASHVTSCPCCRSVSSTEFLMRGVRPPVWYAASYRTSARSPRKGASCQMLGLPLEGIVAGCFLVWLRCACVLRVLRALRRGRIGKWKPGRCKEEPCSTTRRSTWLKKAAACGLQLAHCLSFAAGTLLVVCSWHTTPSARRQNHFSEKLLDSYKSQKAHGTSDLQQDAIAQR